ncbi:hypothetical protein ACFVJ5_04155 [Nocardia sp. NPDC127606]|uniref:hypothetical protein n=1 Tax=Nocardia sp. NPDC127606 TaxID=3345406 RepID=UPI003643C36E
MEKAMGLDTHFARRAQDMELKPIDPNRPLRRHSSFDWPGLVKQIALPEWDFVTDLSPEQEIYTLEVLFDLLDRFLAEREAVS